MAVRGNLANQISQHQSHNRPKDVIISHNVLPKRLPNPGSVLQCLHLPLIDPLLVNLDPRNRVYIGHCESHQTPIPTEMLDNACI